MGLKVAVCISVLMIIGGYVLTLPVTVQTLVGGASPGISSDYSLCLKEVPDSVPIKLFDNSTFKGYSVTYPNGSQTFFPRYSCVRPVHPELHAIASVIGANPKFIAAENGSFYGVEPFSFLGSFGYNDTSKTNYTGLVFVFYSNQRLYPCDIWTYRVLGQIDVQIPLNATGGLELSNVTVQKLPSDELNLATCVASSQTSATSSESTPTTSGALTDLFLGGIGFTTLLVILGLGSLLRRRSRTPMLLCDSER